MCETSWKAWDLKQANIILAQYLKLFQKRKKKHKPPNVNFSALHLINDPQGTCN